MVTRTWPSLRFPTTNLLYPWIFKAKSLCCLRNCREEQKKARFCFSCSFFFFVRLSHRLKIGGVPKCERIFSISFVETRKVRCSKSAKFPIFQIHFGESHLLTALMENNCLAQSHIQKQKCFPRPQFQLIMLYFQRLFPA